MASDGRPAQPKAILRGHQEQVHAAAFYRHNERLLTGDADGFVIAWDLAIMRPRAVWQAHAGAILGLAGWGEDRVITHGRDNKLIVWKLTAEDEASMSTALPLDPCPEPRPLPWMLHKLDVNTMNFCSFSSCPVEDVLPEERAGLLIAVPNALVSEVIDIFHLPSQDRLHTVSLGEKTGMAMALSLFRTNGVLTLIAGYENGFAAVGQLDSQGWTTRYRATAHSQPILSLDTSPEREFFITSGADAIIAKHPLPKPTAPVDQVEVLQRRDSARTEQRSGQEPGAGPSGLSAAFAAQAQKSQSGVTSRADVQTEPWRVINTKHAGQQSLRIRSDGRIFATAGWDSRVRVYSSKTMKEVAVLKWHQIGCFAAAFANIGSVPVAADLIPGAANTIGEGNSAESKSGRDGPGQTQVGPKPAVMTPKEKRITQAKTAHWLAAGSKDGKVSLWDVF